MATKLIIKGAAANPERWNEDFLAKVAEAGDHTYFTQQIFRKWWKKGLDEVFAEGAQLELLLDEHAFTWTVKTLNDKAKKKLETDAELAKVAVHKGKCSGFAPKPVAEKAAVPATPMAVAKPVAKEPPKPAAKPALTAEEIKARVKGTLPVGAKDDAAKYAARLKRVLEAEFDGVTDKHIEAVEALADKVYFAKSKEPVAATPQAKATPTLTATQQAAVDAAMRAAKAAANGPAEMLDNTAQVALGDAITAAVGGKYPTHSRGGGHKGSFNQPKSIQQQLSNIGAILSKDSGAAINAHLAAKWKGYNV